MKPSDLPGRLPRHIIIDENGCWLWTGSVHYRNGYAQAKFANQSWRVHRLTYELLVGPIPTGLVTDHLCNVRRCVNPAHIEIVTQAENLHRRSLRQTHCKQGHARTDENVYLHKSGRRVCKECQKAWSLAYIQRKRVTLKAVA